MFRFDSAISTYTVHATIFFFFMQKLVFNVVQSSKPKQGQYKFKEYSFNQITIMYIIALQSLQRMNNEHIDLMNILLFSASTKAS